MSTKTDMQLLVLSNEQISENVRRIVFEDCAQHITVNDESGYLKLQFSGSDGKQILRSYTIRRVDEFTNQVVIDFVKHDGGFANPWAENAKVGDTLTYKGPGPARMVNDSLDWFILIGDLTALPAIAVNLEKLPANAKGYAIIEVLHESDKQNLRKPDGVELEWVVNGNAKNSQEVMLAAVQAKPWLNGTPYVWIASEFSSAKAIRQYFKQEQSIVKNRYVSSYWKIGENDEGNKRAKAQDGQF